MWKDATAAEFDGEWQGQCPEVSFAEAKFSNNRQKEDVKEGMRESQYLGYMYHN